MDWLDLLAVQGTLRSLLRHYSLKASILWCSPFFMVQLSCLYMTTIKIIALIIQSFISRVINQLFNVLSMFVIAILSRSKCLLILWLQSLFAVILEAKKIKSVTVSPFICLEVLEQNVMIFLFFSMLSFKPAFSLSHLHQKSLSNICNLFLHFWMLL